MAHDQRHLAKKLSVACRNIETLSATQTLINFLFLIHNMVNKIDIKSGF